MGSTIGTYAADDAGRPLGVDTRGSHALNVAQRESKFEYFDRDQGHPASTPPSRGRAAKIGSATLSSRAQSSIWASRSANQRPASAQVGPHHRRAGVDPAVHAQTRGSLRRSRIRRSRAATASPCALSDTTGRRRCGRCARRSRQRHFRRDDADVLRRKGRRRRRDRRVHPRFPPRRPSWISASGSRA